MNKKFLLLLMVVSIAIVAFKSKTPEMPVVTNANSINPDTNLITEEEIGYRHENLYDEDAVTLEKVEWNAAAPGTATKINRSYENAPPMIPHSVEGLVPIKANSNMCLTCHMPAVAAAMKSTSIPKSHFTNYRPAVVEKEGLYTVDAKEGDVVAKDLGDQLNKARYNCTQCHVPQAKISVFIPNDFSPEFRNKGGEQKSNLNETIGEGVK